MFGSTRVGILVVAYNAQSTLAATFDRIPTEVAAEVESIIVCDDASLDDTHEAALAYQRTHDKLPMHVARHPVNLGYGGNQKVGYQLAADMGLDVVVLLHGDGQYAPEVMLDVLAPLLVNRADAVFGSRMMTRGAAREGGMPLYKYVGNKILTRYENAMTGADLSEWHSGYRAYRVSTLQQLPMDSYSNGFDFDTQIILGLIDHGARIKEVPIPTYYGDEICYVDGMKYAKDLFIHTTKYRLNKMGFGAKSAAVSEGAYEYKSDPLSSHGQLLSYLAERKGAEVLDLGCSDGLLSMQIRSLGHTVTGVDLEEHPHVHGRVDKFVQTNLDFGLPSDLPASVDVVVCADVLEHVRQPEVLLEELAPRLAAGGAVLASIPNFGHWYPRFRTLLGVFDYDRRGILDRTHVRFFTRRSFERMARGAGYQVRRVGATGLPFDVADRGGSGSVSAKLKPIRAIDRALVRLRPQLFAYQFLYELKR
jgi:2-polyprenyl-3-methyl-5-hydroxy-6-metoxy-1,4-benzoquinol methylase